MATQSSSMSGNGCFRVGCCGQQRYALLDADQGIDDANAACDASAHIERSSKGAIVFRHADGSPYRQPLTSARIDAHTKVFSALRNLGFRELEVKAALAELRADSVLADATVQQLLREALCRIQPRAR